MMMHPEMQKLLDTLPANTGRAATRNSRGEIAFGTTNIGGVTVHYVEVSRNATHGTLMGQSEDGTRLYRGSHGEDYSLIADLPEGTYYQLPDSVEVNGEWRSFYEVLIGNGITPFGKAADAYFREHYAATNTVMYWPLRLREVSTFNLP